MSNSKDVPDACEHTIDLNELNALACCFKKCEYLMMNDYQIIDNVHGKASAVSQLKYMGFLWSKTWPIQ